MEIAAHHHNKIEALLAQSSLTGPLLARWFDLGLEGKWLCAGAVFQTVWNDMFSCMPEYGIGDIDIIWFEKSAPMVAEQRLEKHLAHAMPGLPKVDAKNEAHVHRWYAQKFGAHIRPYKSVADAVATFPTTIGAIAVQPCRTGGLKVIAPCGVDDLMAGQVRANRRQVTPVIYAAKVRKWKQKWPELDVRPWSLGVN